MLSTTLTACARKRCERGALGARLVVLLHQPKAVSHDSHPSIFQTPGLPAVRCMQLKCPCVLHPEVGVNAQSFGASQVRGTVNGFGSVMNTWCHFPGIGCVQWRGYRTCANGSANLARPSPVTIVDLEGNTRRRDRLVHCRGGGEAAVCVSVLGRRVPPWCHHQWRMEWMLAGTPMAAYPAT